ncbi:MAG: hypothetical protein LBC17_01530 [Lactobacillaceae bacterium]|jgi:RNA-binding protein YlmH|nr:hypothetical protein [Lactobacillaceae bacterium]
MENSTHYTKKEQEFAKIANSIVNQAKYGEYLTHFLNIREQQIVNDFANKENLFIISFGLLNNSEKKKMFLSRQSIDFNKINWNISLLEIEYETKFNNIYHSTILGSLINNGIKFQSIGDIFESDESRWQVIIETSIMPFVISQIKKIGKTHVNIVQKNFDQIIQPKNDSKEITVMLPSLRLDVAIGEILKISRSDAKTKIENNDVKLNFFNFDNVSYALKRGDTISVKGHGRIIFLETIGNTNRNKVKANFLKIGR